MPRIKDQGLCLWGEDLLKLGKGFWPASLSLLKKSRKHVLEQGQRLINVMMNTEPPTKDEVDVVLEDVKNKSHFSIWGIDVVPIL